MSSERAPRPSRNAPPPRARAAGSERRRVHEDDLAYGHDPADRPRRPAVPPRGSDRGRPLDAHGPAGAHSRAVAAEETGGRKLRGIVAVIGVFLLTLAGAAVDSFVGIGLGTITLIALVGSTVLATLLVRRRDLLSMVVAPPLVFTAVAAVNIALAPSATANLATIATLLVRGFPTMAIATVVALVLTLVRWASRR
ncbi:MAG: DUF6542 domain-containing protein [Blastococcus sp.]